MKKDLILLVFVWFAVFLMVSAPVSAAITIEDVFSYGESEIFESGGDGYRAKTDTTNIKVVINISDSDDPEITPDQVKVGEMSFDDCQSTVEGFVCTYSSAENTMLSQNFLNMGVTLYDDYMQSVDSDNTKLIVDKKKPVVQAFEVPSDVGPDFQVDLLLKDEANPDLTDRCSGFKKITLKLGNQVVREIGDVGVGNCTFDKSLKISSAKSGTQSLTVLVEDYVGNTDYKSRQVNIHNNYPSLKSLNILNENGDEIDHIRSGIDYPDFSVELVFDSEDDVKNLDLTLLDFNPETPEKEFSLDSDRCLRNIAGEIICTLDLGAELELNLEQAQNVGVRYNFTDEYDNSIIDTERYFFGIDDEGPVMQYLGTERDQTDDEGNLYVGSNATFVLRYHDAGVGVGEDDVRFIINSYNPEYASSGVPAVECDSSACYLRNVEADNPGSSVTLGINVHDATDKLGNPFEGLESKTLKTDLEAPNNTSRVKFTSLSDRERYYYLVGDRFNAQTVLEDKGLGVDPSSIYLNITEVKPGASLIQGDCSLNDGAYECTWDKVGPLEDTLFDENNEKIIEVHAYDKLGNLNKIEQKMELYLPAGAEKKWWDRIEIRESYPDVDRQVMEFMPPAFDVPLYFVDSSCGTSAFDFASDDSCSENVDDLEIKEAYIDSCEVINVTGGDIDSSYLDYFENARPYKGKPFINSIPTQTRLKFASVLFDGPSSAPDNSVKDITFNCSVFVVSKVGDHLYPPEKENLVFPMSFMNSPFGTIPENVQDEIDKSKDFIDNGFSNVLGWLTKFLGFAQTVCDLYTKLVEYVNALSVVVDVLGKIPGFNFLGSGLGGTVVSTGNSAMTAIKTAIGTTCDIMDCNLNPFSGMDIGIDPTEKLVKSLERSGSDFWHGLANPVNELDTSVNPKDSLVLSAFTLCVPGIILNLNKMREIECNYVSCLKNKVPAGIDPSYCVNEKSYNNCVLVVGEGFHVLTAIIPGYKIFEIVGNWIGSLLKDPLFVGLNLVFTVWCFGACGTAQGCAPCTAMNTVDTLISMYDDIANYEDTWEGITSSSWPDSPCDDLFEDEGDDE